MVDSGEAEAIQLATEQNATLLLIDDRKGRKTAKKRGIHIIGTGGVLIVAKKAGLLAEVSPVLKELASIGYRLSPALCERIIELAQQILHERSWSHRETSPSQDPSGVLSLFQRMV